MPFHKAPFCRVKNLNIHKTIREKEDQEETIADLLLFRHHNEETIIRNGDDLYKLWKHRNKLLSQQQ